MNYYAEAIDIITKDGTDFRALVLEIAKRRPKVVVDAANRPSSMEQEILAIAQSGRKLDAIKLWRQRTGDGLKEAKDAVDALMMKIRA